ncbi:MAG: type II toxin-antitoxin system PemK/MazF family toxin [Candidatus Dormibacteraeota bacterium]|nr:type II toxin-antitoxin system PemK/MazF family toxin [Candidatus Dormibacteraeota bacterium]
MSIATSAATLPNLKQPTKWRLREAHRRGLSPPSPGVKPGEIWWAELPRPAGRRPVILLSRDEAYEVRRLVTVAPVTTRVRGIPVEVPLSPKDGIPRDCLRRLLGGRATNSGGRDTAGHQEQTVIGSLRGHRSTVEPTR